ncbi:MAG: hypothetical protein H7Y42_08200 [Chitinophagaceae bacterium]|nr:hypothetical protein [Chitinophagaceae bacterium]
MTEIINSPWLAAGIGVLLCAAGVYHLHRNVYEEGRTLFAPTMTIIAGVVLIAIGSAKYFNLF